MDLLRDASFENRDGEIVRASMDGKVTALYFSAGWCPPCRKFTPLLKDFHDELEKRKAPFQIVFISFDKSEEEMRQYMKQTHGNWLALQFGDPVLSGLRKHFHIELVPKLLVLREDGSVITMMGRKEVQDKGFSAFRVWHDAAHLMKTP